MGKLSPSRRIKVAGLLMVIALTLAALATAPPAAHATFKFCFKQDFISYYTFYYDPAKTMISGHCTDDCGECSCYGVVTNYYSGRNTPGCL